MTTVMAVMVTEAAVEMTTVMVAHRLTIDTADRRPRSRCSRKIRDGVAS
jgi:hypothetical protein